MFWEDSRDKFLVGVENIAEEIHQVNVEKGFWEEGKDRNDGEMIALMHSELSELLEVVRKEGHLAKCEKVPTIGAAEEEVADLIIRVLDYSHARNLDVGRAVLEKLDYNKSRSYKHGKKF